MGTQETIGHPHCRQRRLRSSPWLRDLVEETRVTADDLIAPLFVLPKDGRRTPVESMPGIDRIPLGEVAAEVKELAKGGIKAVMLFPVLPARLRSPAGDECLNPQGLLPEAIRTVRDACPPMLVFADVALDPYTDHGHDGILEGRDVDNDRTVAALAALSSVLGASGAQFVAPSDMMDGRVQAIRSRLDADGLTSTGILAYGCKFASHFYGPFRDAVQVESRKLDKRTYQLSVGNARQSLRGAQLCEEEGADMLLVKPASLYLDILCRLRAASPLPLAAYQVSGEYAALLGAARSIDLHGAVSESLTSIKRAGADLIVTYFAAAIARGDIPLRLP